MTEAPALPRSPADPTTRRIEYIYAALIVAVASLLGLLVRSRLKTIDVAMVFLLAVVLVASRYRRGPALVASVLSIAVFDFVFVPPYYTFNVHDTAYFLTFGVMLAVAFTMSRLTARIREDAETAREHEQRTAALYALDRELADARNREERLALIARHLERSIDARAVMILADDAGVDRGLPRLPEGGVFENPAVRVAAAWAFQHGEAAGWGMPRCAEAEALAVALRTASETLGVVVLDPGDPERRLGDAARQTVLALAEQASVALERAMLAERNERARVEVEAERLRTALLSSLSHDLRTPLASIEGAASSLLQPPGAMPAEVRAELAETILEESRRMTRLVTNLLDMIRVETGALAVRKAWQPLEEALGVALLRLEQRLSAHPVKTRLPTDLPLVPIDELLIEQVFINLLENAARYTPPGTPITIAAWPEDGTVAVEVADRGPGIAQGQEEAVFERFYRATPTERTDAGAGSGLGLTICRGIIAAHGGRIWAEGRAGGGTAIRFVLPLDGPPMDALPADPLEAPGDGS
jgi:two-component system, OmpR family, sensor histidine kinase KdpD